MPRSIFFVFAVLLLAFDPHGQGDERPKGNGEKPGLGLPPLTGDDAVGVDIHGVNIALRNQYRELSKSRGLGVSVAKASKELGDHLDELVKKDAALKKLGKGEIDNEIRTAAERNRAEALVHAWASLSILAAETDRLAAEAAAEVDPKKKADLASLADLTPLVSLDKPSVLSYLLALAAQVAASGEFDESYKSETAKDEKAWVDPLQFRLKDKSIFGIEFAYDHGWAEGERPAFVKHDRYVPSMGDFVGRHEDGPEPRRDLLSLWGLVNLVVDREGRLSPGGEEVSTRLTRLADWLVSLREHKAMKAIAPATAAKPSLDGRLLSPLGRLESFLRFREAATRPEALAGMADLLASFRRETPANDKPGAARDRLLKAAGEKSPGLKHLVEASAPVGDGGERLPHAAAWLRYALLLSCKGQRAVASEDMAKTWEGFGTGLGLEFLVDANAYAKEGKRPVPAVRWNQQPHRGQASAVVADLSLACLAHLRFSAFVAARQKKRFEALRTTDAAKTYFDKGFDDALKDLDQAYRSRLAPHFARTKGEAVETTFPPPGEPARLAEVDRYGKGNPLPPPKDADPEGSARRSAFAASATAAERLRFRDDLLVLAIEMQRTVQVQTAVRDAVKEGKPFGFQLLAGLGGPGLGDLGELPRKTFPQYKKDLDDRARELREEVKVREAESALVAAYGQSRDELQQARAELEAARLGRRITEKAVELSEVFKEIAHLDVQIQELGERMAVLEKQARDKSGEAAGLRLVLATRVRDLAARKVEALIAASEQAEKIAKEATESIEHLAGQFDKAANDGKKRKERERGFGILKAIVSVVGAVLAPFTGGASLTVAMMVNKAVDIYKRIDETDWQDFGAAAATVASVGEDAAGIVDTGIANFGGPKAKAALTDVKKFINEKKAKLEDLKGQAEQLGKKLAEAAKLNTGAAVALANGFPVTFDDKGRLKVDLGNRKVRFTDKKLEESLNHLIEGGRYVLNDLEGRGAEGLGKLAGLPPAELKAKLGEAMRGAIKELPPEFTAAISEAAKAKGEAALIELKGRVEGLDDEGRRVLAHALAGGMLFIKDGNVVVAIERPFDKEARQLEARLEAHARNVARGEIGVLVTKIGEIRDRLEKKGQELIKASDDEALKVLAREHPAEAIKEVKTEVENLKEKLEAAKLELKDKEDERTIVDYEAAAARLLADKAGTLVEQAKLHKDRAALVVKQANLAAELEVLRGDQATALIRAAEIKVARLEDLVRQRFDRCLANGVNPSSSVKSPEMLPLPLASLRGVLSGHLGRLDVVNRPVVEAAAADVLGLIQWCEMLGLSGGEGKTPLDYYASLLTHIASGDEASVVCGRLKAMGVELDKLFASKAGIRTRVRYTNPNITPSNIVWRDGDRGAEIEEIAKDIPAKYREKVLGAFRYRVEIDGSGHTFLPAATRGEFPEPKALLDESAAYFVDRNKIRLILDRDNFHFVVIPPAVAQARLGRPLVIGPSRDAKGGQMSFDEKEVTSSEAADKEKDKIETDLGLLRGVDLTGALGEWTVLIIKSNAAGEVKRNEAINDIKNAKLRFTLRMYYLEVTR
ncbi:hypothetical protein [Gemmata sp.]|uniref:hypothetical protein n=1 Tax=Gemmata sp. TaxID=1914242 RepID=UPI003F70D673